MDDQICSILNHCLAYHVPPGNVFFTDITNYFTHMEKLKLMKLRTGVLCRYQFDRLPSPPGTPGLLHRNVCPAPGLLHNRKCPGAGPMKDDVPGAGHLYQLAFKHENC